MFLSVQAVVAVTKLTGEQQQVFYDDSTPTGSTVRFAQTFGTTNQTRLVRAQGSVESSTQVQSPNAVSDTVLCYQPQTTRRTLCLDAVAQDPAKASAMARALTLMQLQALV